MARSLAAARASGDGHSGPDGWLDELKAPLRTTASVRYDHREVRLEAARLGSEVEVEIEIEVEVEIEIEVEVEVEP